MSVKKKKIDESNSATAGNPVDPAALAQLTQQTRNLLAFHRELGIAGYPATPELRNFLATVQPAANRPVPPQHRAATNNNKRPAPVVDRGSANISTKFPSKPSHQATPEVSVKSATRQLESIAKAIAECRSCPSATEKTGIVSRLENSMPRLFVAGDCFIGSDVRKGIIWGQEEDELFWKMMAAIGLDHESVYVANSIKCCQPATVPPDSEAEQRCFSFLEQELLAIQPGLICAMGEVATRLLLKNKTPLIRMRGRFHPYRYPNGNRGLVMPTFHPRFLLQHPEMKRATWEDLQALQRKLPVPGKNG